MRVHRLIAILMMIEKQGIVKAKDLADDLEVSDRTIYRDVDALCQAGFPLYCTTGPKGGIQFTEGYRLGIGDSTEIKVTDLLSHLPATPSNARAMTTIETGLQTLEQLLNTAKPKEKHFRDRILIDDESWWGEAADPFDIRLLMEALWQQRTLIINYSKQDGSPSTRKVNAYGLILKHTIWYLVGFCQEAKAMRTFRCDRIATAHLTEEPYLIPGAFNLSQHWHKAVDTFRASRRDNEEYLVTIEIPATYANRFEDKVITWNHKENGRYIATINMNSESLARAELLSYVSFVKVLKPQAMVDYAREVLERQIGMYI